MSNMEVMFPDVKRTFLRKCPKCGSEIFHLSGTICGGKLVDQITECDCEIDEGKRKNAIKLGKEIQKQKMEGNLDSSGIRSGRYLNMLSEMFRGPNEAQFNRMMEWAQSFTEDTKDGFLILGTPGTGKTMASVKLLNEVISQGYTGYIINAAEFYNMIRESYDTDSNVYQTIKAYENCDLLVLDDLGAEYDNEDSKSRIAELLISRFGKDKPIIITSNLTLEMIRKRYGDRVASRLNGWIKRQVLKGPDMRSL